VSEFYVSRITTKGQVTVPLELRKVLNIKEGDYILFEKKGTSVEIKKMQSPIDFEEFARPVRERFQREGMSSQDVDEAIKWARRVKDR